jgi:hypothetical protein
VYRILAHSTHIHPDFAPYEQLNGNGTYIEIYTLRSAMLSFILLPSTVQSKFLENDNLL